MRHMFKTVTLAGALCVALLGCATSAPSDDPAESSSAAELVPLASACPQFCKNQGGTFYLALGATSLAACNSQHGDWFPPEGSEPPPPGCCCRCSRPGFCL